MSKDNTHIPMINELNTVNRENGMTRILEVVPYDMNWPQIFKAEAALLQNALGDNCIAVHPYRLNFYPWLSCKTDNRYYASS
jgi:hypothetical protein